MQRFIKKNRSVDELFIIMITNIGFNNKRL